MFNGMMILNKVLKQGKACLLPMLLLLENLSISLFPETDKLEALDDNEYDELDDIAMQWFSLWDSLTKQRKTRNQYYGQDADFMAIDAAKTVVLLHAVDVKLLSHVYEDSAVKRIQACHRNVGDPAPANQVRSVGAVSSSFITFNQNNITHIKKHRKTMLSLLCFFHFNPVKNKRGTLCILFV